MFGEPLRHLVTTESTNDDALRWARDGAPNGGAPNGAAPHGSVVRADSQTRGRGRLGRSWVSPPNLGLYVSVILRPDMEIAQVPQLTMLAALAACDAIEEQTHGRAGVKWPNDIILHNRKVGGILSEARLREARLSEARTQEESSRVEFAVVGIGLNVNFQASDLPHDAKVPASSLRLESGDLVSCDALFKSLMFALQNRYESYISGCWPDLKREFESRDVLQGRLVRVESERETYHGRISGMDEDGVLKVRTESGVRRVVAGDVKWDEEHD
jgi:BirA family biotin operon repressor/biotin-[acetyl-CoA-carboxylase] ligase